MANFAYNDALWTSRSFETANPEDQAAIWALLEVQEQRATSLWRVTAILWALQVVSMCAAVSYGIWAHYRNRQGFLTVHPWLHIAILPGGLIYVAIQVRCRLSNFEHIPCVTSSDTPPHSYQLAEGVYERMMPGAQELGVKLQIILPMFSQPFALILLIIIHIFSWKLGVNKINLACVTEKSLLGQ